MSMAERFVLANLSTEMGGKASYVQFDAVTRAFVARHNKEYEPILPDEDALYRKTFQLNVEGMEPLLACPHAVDNVRRVREVGGREIHQAFIGTCAGGRLGDFEMAARILKGERVHRGVRFLIAPASRAIFKKAIELGYVPDLLSAGATVLPPGCGP